MTSAAAASAPSPARPFLVLSGIRKAYPGVLALQGFSMSVAPGEVIGLVGENGAGKSTLMKILGGVIAPDGGTITIDGIEEKSLSVANSMRAGIAFVHQELNLFDNLDVAANVFIGREPRLGGVFNFVDTAKQRQMADPYLKRLGASFTAATPVSQLSLAQQQIVEIAKALSTNARLVILDEPTSSLPLSETAKLLDVIAALKRDGIAQVLQALDLVQRIDAQVVRVPGGAGVEQALHVRHQHAPQQRLALARRHLGEAEGEVGARHAPAFAGQQPGQGRQPTRQRRTPRRRLARDPAGQCAEGPHPQ